MPLLPAYSAYIFDLDGTLTDSSGPIGVGLVKALEAAGIQGVKPEQTHHWIGRPLVEIFSSYVGREVGDAPDDELFAAMLAAYREGHDDVFRNEVIVYPGVQQTLAHLREQGARIAVATTKYTEAAEYCMREAGLEGLVHAICGTDPGEPVKPDPFVVRRAMDALDADARDCLMVGDTPGDIVAAHRAGCHAAAVAWGFGSRDALHEAGPDGWLDRMDDLIAR